MGKFKSVADRMRSFKTLAKAFANFKRNNFLKKLLKIINNITPYFHVHNFQEDHYQYRYYNEVYLVPHLL